MKIKKLSERTINRIAAGEVVERPLSVVKELIENSIDAGATDIKIEISRGGRNLILVADNGEGMDKADLLLAIERHATSKLNEEDILNINFHGFRGEALPSIASVSNMKIASRYISSSEAWEIRLSGGEVKEILPSPIKSGTSIEVRDLFYFTPNRLKFLKQESTEVSAIIDLINRFTLCHPHISFQLISDGKLLVSYKQHGSNLLGEDDRVGQVLGEEFLRNSVEVDCQRGNIRLSGRISMPTYSRRSSTNYLTYVNKRMVKDKLFTGAIRAAYSGLLPRDKYPIALLFLEVDPYDVDVNVHPTKAEVRFKDENSIRSFIISQLRKSLSSPQSQSAAGVVQSYVEHPHNMNVPSFLGGLSREFYKPAPSLFSEQKYHDAPKLVHDNANEGFLQASKIEPLSSEEYPDMPHISTEKSDGVKLDLGYAKCQINNMYIIAEVSDGFIIVDQHAAHERLLLERMKQEVSKGGVKREALLIPHVVEIGAANVEMLIEFKESLMKSGVVIERHGISQVIVREIPSLFKGIDVDNMIIEIADYIQEYGSAANVQEKLEDICGDIACHSSITAGKKLSIEEMNAILRDMERTPFSSQCNHGRPTFKKLSLYELNKLFERS